MIRINVMKKGDSILSVTDSMIAVKRKNGEVDLIPILKGENSLYIDQNNIVTIGYGDNVVIKEDEDICIYNF